MNRNLFYLLFVGLIVSSCEKKKELLPAFDVTASAQKIKAGEALTFNFTGEAGVLYFYSGEFGNEYDYKEGRVVGLNAATLSFQTKVQFGTQPDQLRVMVSKDFNGEYTIPSVHNATWKDITSLFVLSTSTATISSTVQDITNLIDPEKPLYIAYKYTTLPQAVNGSQRTWTVYNTTLTTITALGTSILADQKTAAWTLVQTSNINDPARALIAANSGTLTLRGNSGANTEVETEIWAVSKPMGLGNVDLGPDRSVPIKNTLDNRMESYKHTYTKPGTYKAVFVASNVSIYGQEQVSKEITINVEP
jgi:hypothetical protein